MQRLTARTEINEGDTDMTNRRSRNEWSQGGLLLMKSWPKIMQKMASDLLEISNIPVLSNQFMALSIALIWEDKISRTKDKTKIAARRLLEGKWPITTKSKKSNDIERKTKNEKENERMSLEIQIQVKKTNSRSFSFFVNSLSALHWSPDLSKNSVLDQIPDFDTMRSVWYDISFSR